jgi:ketosteroid isomerase-like protein
VKIAGRLVPIAVLALAGVLEAGPAADEAELTRLLREFLAGASRNDAAAHERFWAEDLIYTGSSGRRIGKADILADLRAPQGPHPAESATTYTAEDIRIQQYGDTAIVAFRLVGTNDSGGRTQVTRYLNTGTFLRRKGGWQVVSWQATKASRSEEQSRSEVAAAQAAIDRSILAADVKALEPLLDESFLWTHPTGERGTRRELLDDLGAGTRPFPKRETGSVTVSVYGDAAIAYASFSTTTFVNEDGVWKAVALHTSRAP